jgi:hypothetical protein
LAPTNTDIEQNTARALDIKKLKPASEIPKSDHATSSQRTTD